MYCDRRLFVYQCISQFQKTILDPTYSYSYYTPTHSNSNVQSLSHDSNEQKRHHKIPGKQQYIPLDVQDLIYKFYTVCDEWDRKYERQTKTRISNYLDRSVIHFNHDNETLSVISSVYGTKRIKKGIQRWRLRMTHISKPEFSHIRVGIIKADPENLNDYLNSVRWFHCGYQVSVSTGNCYSRSFLTTRPTVCRSRSGSIDVDGLYKQVLNVPYEYWLKRPNSILEIVLDMNKRTLEFQLDSFESEVAFSCIDKSIYRLALTSMNWINVETIIELI